MYLPSIAKVLNELKIQNPYYKNLLYTVDMGDNLSYTTYMEVQYHSLDLFKHKFPEAEDLYLLQLKELAVSTLIFFILIQRAYHAQDAFYITLLLVIALILLNYSFNLSAVTL